jgi:hypothetical protein
MTMRIVGTALATLILAIALLTVPPVALASDHIINIPALAFVPDGTATVGERNPNDWGTLINSEGKFFAAVQFPKLNRSICEFRLYTWDNDELDMTARLMRKGTGAGQTTSAATVIASVSSSGADTSTRSFVTTAITSPLISSTHFYFVELDIPFSTFMVLGVRIVHKDVC